MLARIAVVSLNIKEAFDKTWWDELLKHLWNICVRLRAFCLLSSYSVRYLFVVANGQESSLYPISAGVPQSSVWSPMLFNLYVHYLPS